MALISMYPRQKGSASWLVSDQSGHHSSHHIISEIGQRHPYGEAHIPRVAILSGRKLSPAICPRHGHNTAAGLSLPIQMSENLWPTIDCRRTPSQAEAEAPRLSHHPGDSSIQPTVRKHLFESFFMKPSGGHRRAFE